MNQTVDIARLAEAISRCLPGITEIEPLKVVGEGFRSFAVETNGGILLRLGKTAEAASGFELEMKALPVVRHFVSAPMPDPRWHIRPCNDFPFGALGYVKLSGSSPVPLDASLAEFFIPELAEFLVALHAVSIESAKAADVPVVDPLKRLEGARPVVMPVLAARMSRSDVERLEGWWKSLPIDADHGYRPSVCHHDLWYENLLVDSEGHLSGVLDWSHIEVGDPAHDFAAIHHFGPDLTTQFIAEYRAAGGTLDENALQRTQCYWEGRELGGLAWAIENDDRSEIEDRIRKLMDGPIFS